MRDLKMGNTKGQKQRAKDLGISCTPSWRSGVSAFKNAEKRIFAAKAFTVAAYAGNARRWLQRFPSLNTLNDWLEERCRAFWAMTPYGKVRGTIAEAWAEEAQSLMPASRPFDGFVEYTKRVSPTCLAHLERNRFSVPASFANRPVSLKVYPDRVVIVVERQIICEHLRIFNHSHQGPGQTVYDRRHYMAVVQRKPGALRNGAPFTDLPEAFRTLQLYLRRNPSHLPVLAVSLAVVEGREISRQISQRLPSNLWLVCAA